MTSPSASMDADPLIGIELGGYRVTRLLAAGGMGLVYEALHEAIGRRAAVKVLKPEYADDEEWSGRFISEARALGSLKHRNLVEILNFGKTPDGRQFLMMEFLDGQSLDRLILERAPLAPAVALNIVDQIVNGLSEAHKKGVVHRDLKPGNVQLLREHNGETLVKVLDFGLARQNPVSLLSGEITLGTTSAASLVAGTPDYIAPEQAQGKKVKATADLYSLGVMLFEMLTGRLPFAAPSVTELLGLHVSEPPPLVASFVNNLPEGLEELVQSLLEKNPEDRPASADEVRVSIQRLLKRLSQDATSIKMRALPEPVVPDAPTTRRLAPVPEAPATRPRARAAVLVGGAMVGTLVALVVGVVFARGGPEPTPPEASPPTVEAPVVPALPAVPPPVVPPPVAPVEVVPAPSVAPVIEAPGAVVPVRPTKEPRPAVPEKGCQPTEAWKKRLKLDIAEMGENERVIGDAALYEVWDRSQARLVKKIVSASTSADCGKAQADYEQLRARLRFR